MPIPEGNRNTVSSRSVGIWSGVVAVGLLLVICAGCADNRAPSSDRFDPGELDGNRVLEEVKELVRISPRDAGTEGADAAAEYLQSALRKRGVDARIDRFTTNCPLGAVEFRNVVGVVPGSDDSWIVLGSHYDTKSGMPAGFQGANDSGSSSGLLLELAGIFARRKGSGPGIMLVFFDGEECMKRYGPSDGLHGSRRMAEVLKQDGRADRVRAVIVLDMIGDAALSVTLPKNCTPFLVSSVLEAAHEEKCREDFGLSGTSVLDDHVPFMDAGMPAVDIIDFEFGSAPGKNDYWHTGEDTVDKLSEDSLQKVGRVTLRVVNGLMAEGMRNNRN